jgi:hypothetical protein
MRAEISSASCGVQHEWEYAGLVPYTIPHETITVSLAPLDKLSIIPIEQHNSGRYLFRHARGLLWPSNTIIDAVTRNSPTQLAADDPGRHNGAVRMA